MNYPAVQANMHEVDVVGASIPNPFGSMPQPNWVVALNNYSMIWPSAGNLSTNMDVTGELGYAFSSDSTGSSWTASSTTLPPTLPPNGWEEANWIPPGTPTSGSFAGWRSDPSIATIGNPPDGTQLAYTFVVASTTSDSSDVGMLVSSDGGQTFGSPAYITNISTNGGGGVDQPQIVTNHDWPYSTIVSWESNANSIPSSSWITSINNVTHQPNSSSQYPATWDQSSGTGGMNQPKVVFTNNNGYVRPKIAVGSMPWAGTGTGCNDGSTHELIYVAWSTNSASRQCSDVNGNTTASVSWNMAIFDNTANQWAPVTYNLSNDMTWPYCVAGSGENLVYNISTPYLVTDGQNVAVVHNHWTQKGTRIELDQWTVTCVDGQISASPIGTGIVMSPDPCYNTPTGLPGWCPPGHTGGNGSNGNNVINDQWGARVAFQTNSGVPYLLVVWYDTSLDQTNMKVRINGAMNTSGIGGTPYWVGNTSTIYQVSQASAVPAGQVVPWLLDPSVNNNYWWDYLGIGIDWVDHSFLAAWGGDMRLVGAGGPAGIWTALITTP